MIPWSAPDSILEDLNHDSEGLPEVFKEAKIKTSFAVNTWKLTLTLAFIIMIGYILQIVSVIVSKRSEKMEIFLQRIKTIFHWNFFLILFCGCISEI